jgi:hypothetical protein
MVRNTGLWATENLAIMDHIQVADDCGYRDVAVFPIDTSGHPVLCPGESYCYYYEYEFDGVAGMSYRNLACVSITNMASDARAVAACDGFDMPAAPTITEVDEKARLIDCLMVPKEFSHEVDNIGPWTLCDNETIVVTVRLTDMAGVCDQRYLLRNMVCLTELDTCQKRQDCARVCLVIGPCHCDQSALITVDQTIDGTWSREITYDWTVDKSVSDDHLALAKGESATVTYTIVVTRNAVGIIEDVDIFGHITVANIGDVPTADLQVRHVLYVTISSVESVLVDEGIDISAMPVLLPGESHDYDFMVDVTEELLTLLQVSTLPDSLADISFRHVMSASITNYAGHEGAAFAVEDEASYGIVGSPVLTEIDEEAVLSDVFTALPAGFEVTNTTLGPWSLSGSDLVNGEVTVSWSSKITNVDAECGSTFDVGNEATVTEGDSQATRSDEHGHHRLPGMKLRRGTRQGYWKNHAVSAKVPSRT